MLEIFDSFFIGSYIQTIINFCIYCLQNVPHIVYFPTLLKALPVLSYKRNG